MFGFFRNHKDAQRKSLRIEFDATLADIRVSSLEQQKFIGHGANVASSAFLHGIGSLDQFLKLPEAKKADFLAALEALERKLDKGTHPGFALFKQMLRAMALNDTELAMLIMERVEELASKGNSGEDPKDYQRKIDDFLIVNGTW